MMRLKTPLIDSTNKAIYRTSDPIFLLPISTHAILWLEFKY
jgi:hypothetical protein